MKNRILRLGLSGMALFSSLTFADHTDGELGSVDALVSESIELQQVVQYSYLRPQVKNSVYYFVNSVRYLDSCADNYGRLGSDESEADHGTDTVRDHNGGGGVPYQCRYQLDQVRRNFYPVSRYLYDTNYDYPQVYQSYLSTRQALNAIR